MKITLVGATGNIGSRILDEALARGHQLTGTTRDAAKLPARADLNTAELNTADTTKLAAAMRGSDAVIVAVKWTENDIHQVIEAVRQSGVKRALFVVGAGSLIREDGRLHFDHMKDKGIVPPTSQPAMHALEVLRGVEDLDWTAISPPFDIHPGERTGKFVLGGDEMPRPTEGQPIARISREDFAVAILDEIETPRHIRRRFTAAN
jgi:uncharacterized protein